MFRFNKYFYRDKNSVVLMTVLMCVCVALLYVGLALNRSITNAEQDIYVYVDSDDTVDSIHTKVAHACTQEHLMFKTLTQWVEFKPRIGRYKITSQNSVFKTFLMFRNGQQTPTKLLIPTGWSVERISNKICAQLMMDSASLMNLVNDSLALTLLECTRETLPARFVPNTYEVWWTIKPDALLKRISREYKAFWNEDRRQKAKNIGLTPDEVSTLASIVCRETNNTQEMPIIARVYFNRLKRHMPLQSCPTVIFARKDFSLTRLRNPMIPDSPYNTYKYAGLPPGPICIPTIKSIDAVLNMPIHNYLYMCAKEDFSGTHHFSASYTQHQRYAARYQKAYKKRFGNKN